MNQEIENIEKIFQKSVTKLKNYVDTILIKINGSNISKPIKNLYISKMKKFYIYEYKKLENKKLEEIKKIKEKYNKNDTIGEKNITKKACLVGINYNHTSYQLHGCVNDVYTLKSLLEKKFNYKSENITMLLNEQATREKILIEFVDLLKTAQEGDQLFFSFSGHGVYIDDKNFQEIDGKDEVIVSADYYGIIDDEIKYLIDTYLKANVKLFTLFDCCHSGTIMDLKYQHIDNKSIIHNQSDTKSQVICISGCKDNQQSVDAYIKGQFNGALTWAFNKVMSENNNQSWKSCIEDIKATLLGKNFQQTAQLTSGLPLNLNDTIFF